MKLTGYAIPIQTPNFYALTCAALFLAVALPLGAKRPLRFPQDNLKDTIAHFGRIHPVIPI